jgi:hypothetical protein
MPAEGKELDPDMKVSDLTVSQFMEMISFEKRSAELAKLETQYRKGIAELKVIESQSASIFSSVKDLTHATTPFTIFNVEEARKFMVTVESALEAGQQVILAMAFKGG